MRLPRPLWLGGACVVLLLATACGAGGGIADPGASRLTLKVAVLDGVDGVDGVTAYIAKDHGYFAAEGLDVDIAAAPVGTSALSLLRHGDAQVALADYVDVFQAASRGEALRVACDAYQLAPQVRPILALPTARIRTPRDLAGKRIGVPVVGAAQTLLINELVGDYGVSPASVRYVAMPPASMSQALAAGDVDAVAPAEPFATEVESARGADVVADVNAGAAQNVPLSGYVTTSAWAGAHARQLAAFRRAMQHAAADASRRVVVESALARYEGMDPRVAALVHLGGFPVSVNAARLERVVDLMTQAHLLAKPLSLAAMTS